MRYSGASTLSDKRAPTYDKQWRPAVAHLKENLQRNVVTLPTTSKKKLIVLDTSVLLHDPEALFRFDEHDVFISRKVLKQLDNHKRGQSDVARNARQVTRVLDSIFRGDEKLMRGGAPLSEISRGSATGKVFFQMESLAGNVPKDLLDDEADRKIIGVAVALRQRKSRAEYGDVLLVTKDVNMRYAALCLKDAKIQAQDYLYDHVLLKDSDVLPTGCYELPADFWHTHETVRAWKHEAHQFWHVQGPLISQMLINDCFFTTDENFPFVKVVERTADKVILRSLIRYDHSKNAVCGIVARNREQLIALDHLMDPEIDLVMLLGDAGTGKSLCAVAAAYAHVCQECVSSILATRAMVPVEGEELGFLPGDMNDKFDPWMLALEDSKSVLLQNAGKTKDAKLEQIVRDKKLFENIPIGFLRGCTFDGRFVIVDEAQNLTPRQVKLLATRPGNGAKIVFCGNISQIDTPFLDENSSGLPYLVMRMQDCKHAAHVILQDCVRSRLAKLAVERL